MKNEKAGLKWALEMLFPAVKLPSHFRYRSCGKRCQEADKKEARKDGVLGIPSISRVANTSQPLHTEVF